jgi:hypothetical protein
VVEGLIDRLAVKSEEDNRVYRTTEGCSARIHRSSRSANHRHQIVAFGEIIVTEKANGQSRWSMRCVVPVDPVHLGRIKSSLIDRGDILKFPPPQKLKSGVTVGYIKPTYKPLDFILPTVDIPLDT